MLASVAQLLSEMQTFQPLLKEVQQEKEKLVLNMKTHGGLDADELRRLRTIEKLQADRLTRDRSVLITDVEGIKADNDRIDKAAKRASDERRNLEAELEAIRERRRTINRENKGFDNQMENNSLIAECLKDEIKNLSKN